MTMWRYGGALDNVLVISGEDVRVQNLEIEAGWVGGRNEVPLDLFVDLLNLRAKAGEDLMVSAIIQDPEGALVHTTHSRLVERIDTLDLRRQQQIHLCAHVPMPLLWSAENPALYSLLLTLETRSGTIYDAVATEFGVRRPTAHTYEILNVHQKIWIEAVKNKPGTFQICNHFDYLSLKHFEPRWELVEDGVSMAKGTLAPLPIGPQHCGKMHVPKISRCYTQNRERVLKISFHAIEGAFWASRGQCVAQAQFNLTTDLSYSINWEVCHCQCA